MSHIPGGGIKSKNVTNQSIRTGPGGRGVNEGGAGQIGSSVGDKVTNVQGSTGYRGEQFYSGQNFQPVRLGNELATNVGGGGPGKGRTLYGQSGQQGTHGAVNPGSPRSNPRHNALENE